MIKEHPPGPEPGPKVLHHHHLFCGQAGRCRSTTVLNMNRGKNVTLKVLADVQTLVVTYESRTAEGRGVND